MKCQISYNCNYRLELSQCYGYSEYQRTQSQPETKDKVRNDSSAVAKQVGSFIHKQSFI